MIALLFACNPDPRDDTNNVVEQVGYRYPDEGDATSGERGTISLSEILWAGSVDDDGHHDPTDVFIELRNQGSLPVNLSGWQLRIRGEGVTRTVVLPDTERLLGVSDHAIVATKNTGCFPNPDFITPDLALGEGDPFYIRLQDKDERQIDDAGDRSAPPFAGGWDLRRTRSMERVQLMFSGQGTEPQVWHYYTPVEVDVPNNDKIAERCRARTLASPGRPNSPDYSGAFAAGSAD